MPEIEKGGSSSSIVTSGLATDATLAQIRDEIGATNGAKEINPNNTATINQIVKGILQQLLTQLPAGLGQTAMTGSLPVAIANNQSAVPISGAVTVSSGTIGVNSLPAAAPTTDGIGTADRLEEAYSGLTAAVLAVGSTTANAGWASLTSGSTANVAVAVASKKIAILGAVVLTRAAVATTIQFFEGASSGAATTAISPQWTIGDSGGTGRGFVIPGFGIPWLKIATAGRYLTATAGAGAGVDIVAITAAY